MNPKCYHIFTHKDLDGIISLMVFRWAKPDAHISYRAVTNLNVEAQIQDYLENTINPHDTYVVDLALRESFQEFDLPFFKFIDHHQRSEEFKPLFKNAKLIIRPEYGSNCRMLYKFFSDNGVVFSDAQKTLILLGDDFDSGKNKVQSSYDLNILFWAEYRNDINRFLKDYEKGFKAFLPDQNKIINTVKHDAAEKAESLPIFKGNLKLCGKNVEVLSSFGEYTNLVSLDILMKTYDTNIMFFINTKNEKISMKQRYSENLIDLSSVAQKYCEGNGNTMAATGKITDLFMELTKNLNPL